MAVLAAAAAFAALWLGSKMKLDILASHVLDAAKLLYGIPDFKYYVLADGLRALLTGTAKPFRRHADSLASPLHDLPLFSR